VTNASKVQYSEIEELNDLAGGEEEGLNHIQMTWREKAKKKGEKRQEYCQHEMGNRKGGNIKTGEEHF